MLRRNMNSGIIVLLVIFLSAINCIGAEQKDTEYSTETNIPVFKEGYYIVGDEIPAGTYDVHIINGLGSLRTYESNEARAADEWNYIDDLALADADTMELFAVNEDPVSSGTSMTAHNILLKDGMCIAIGTMEVQFEKADDGRDAYPEGTVLETGYHIVGIDIDPGTYTFRCVGGMGTVRTFESNEERLADQWGYKEDFALEINEGSDGGYSYPDEMHHVILSDGKCVFIGTMRVVLERES